MNSKLILLIGAGVLLYLWYENQHAGAATSSASGLPSDAVPVLASSGAPMTSNGAYVWYSPSAKQVYTGSAAPTSVQISGGAAYWATAAGQQVYAALTGQQPASQPAQTTGTSPAQPVALPTSSGPPSTNVQPETYQTPQGGHVTTPTNLAGLWAAIQQWAAADTGFTNSNGVLSGLPDHWTFYVGYIWPYAPAIMTGTTPTAWPGVWPPDPQVVFPGVDPTQPMSASTFWAGMSAYLQKGGLGGLHGLAGLGDNAFRVRGRGGWAA